MEGTPLTLFIGMFLGEGRVWHLPQADLESDRSSAIAHCAAGELSELSSLTFRLLFCEWPSLIHSTTLEDETDSGWLLTDVGPRGAIGTLLTQCWWEYTMVQPLWKAVAVPQKVKYGVSM